MPAATSPESPAYRVPAVEPDKDGRLLFTRAWYLYLQQLGTLLGANPTSEDLGQAPPDLANVASLQMQFETFREGLDQQPLADVYSGLASPVDDLTPPTYLELVAQVNELRKQIEELRQGPLVL